MNRISFVLVVAAVIICLAVSVYRFNRANNPSNQLCGPYSLSLICQYFGIKADLYELTDLCGTNASGTTMLGLYEAANQKGLSPEPLSLEFDELQEYLPCIVFFKPNHFVVVKQILGDSISIEDQTGQTLLTHDSFVQKWNGATLVFHKELSSKETVRFSEEEPRLVFAETSYDIGEILVGQIASHQFKLTNLGRADLIISRLAKSCGCLSASLLKDEPIRPMEDNALIMKVKKESQGKFQEEVEVRSNDPTNPSIFVTMKGTFIQPIVTQPSRLNLGLLSPESVVKKQITIEDTDRRHLQVQTSNLISSYLSVHIQRLEPFKVKAIITTKPPLPIGIVAEKLNLTFTHELQGTLEIPIVAEVRGTFLSSPRTVIFGTVPVGTVETRTVSISSADTDIHLTRVKHDLKGIEVELKAEEGWANYQLYVSLTPDAPLGMLQGHILTYSTTQDLALTIPVYGYIRN